MIECPACGYDYTLCVENTYTITLHQSAQSLNAVGVNSKNNRGYRGARNRWKRLLTPFATLPKADGYRRIFFTRYWGKGKRAFDYGNLVGGLKPLLDEIVRAGHLVDDSPKQCAEYYAQYKSNTGKDYVTVLIEDVS
tara:strand:- start:2873 stop:3283 length:411 start_codon:yes stop_codon:yes gene_type:complete